MASKNQAGSSKGEYKWRYVAVRMDMGFETWLSTDNVMMLPPADSLELVMKHLSMNSNNYAQIAKWFSQFLSHCKDSYILSKEIIETPTYGETQEYVMSPSRHLLIKTFGPPWPNTTLVGVQKFSIYDNGRKFQTFKVSGGGTMFKEITESRAESWMKSPDQPDRLSYEFNHYPKPPH